MLDALTLKRDTAERDRAEDDELNVIRLARDGDVDAFDGLVRRYERRVLKLAYQMVGNRDDAQDVAQDVFVRLWKYLSKIRDEAKFSTWLYRMVVNSSYDLLSRRRQSYHHVSFDDPNGNVPEVADEAAVPLERGLVARDLKDKVLAALDRLTPSERTVFVLRDIEGLEVSQIAGIHESSKVTVRRHLSNARHKMRAILIELDPGLGKPGPMASAAGQEAVTATDLEDKR